MAMHARDVPISNPCHVAWASMTRREASKRFCKECRKHVHDLSSMTESEARALLESPVTEDLCIRTFATPDGERPRWFDSRCDLITHAELAARVGPDDLVLFSCPADAPFVDTLRACPSGNTWVLENNGVCGTRTSQASGSTQGPGGKEFYTDGFATPTGPGGTHQEITLGGLAQAGARAAEDRAPAEGRAADAHRRFPAGRCEARQSISRAVAVSITLRMRPWRPEISM